MLDFIHKYRDYAEFFYLCSGPLLLIGLVIGILQIKFMRNEACSRTRREAKLISMELLEKKIDALSKLSFEITQMEKDKPNSKFNGKIIDLKSGVLSSSDDWINLLNTQLEELSFKTLDLFSVLEDIAHYAFSGVADEKFMFESEGIGIISIIDEYKHYLALHRHNHGSNAYSQTLELYEKWSLWIEQEDLIARKNSLTTMINKIKRIKPTKIINLD